MATAALAAARPAAGAGRTSVRTAPLRLASAPASVIDLGQLADEAFGPHHVGDDLAEVVELRARPAPLRPRWGRIAAVVAGLAVLLALGMVTMAGADGDQPLGPTVSVAPGETLWDLAVDATPAGGDPRATLAEIQRINGFTDATLSVWTPVVLPVQ